MQSDMIFDNLEIMILMCIGLCQRFKKNHYFYHNIYHLGTYVCIKKKTATLLVGFMSMRHLSYHFWKRAMFCWHLRVIILVDLYCTNTAVLFAHRNLCAWLFLFKGMLCVIMLNRVGHSTEPWGTPALKTLYLFTNNLQS